jgi:hypothetical protein
MLIPFCKHSFRPFWIHFEYTHYDISTRILMRTEIVLRPFWNCPTTWTRAFLPDRQVAMAPQECCPYPLATNRHSRSKLVTCYDPAPRLKPEFRPCEEPDRGDLTNTSFRLLCGPGSQKQRLPTIALMSYSVFVNQSVGLPQYDTRTTKY